MKKTDAIVQSLISAIEGKDILEAACGSADFSRSAAKYARRVSCVDVDGSRIKQALPDNVHFERMDAAAMRFPDETFDTVFIYDAFAHIQTKWTEIEKECRRVLKPGGRIYILSTRKIDSALLRELYGAAAQQQNDFMMVIREK